MKKSFTPTEIVMAKRKNRNKCLHFISQISELKEQASNKKTKAAFTLAEVLITLAIIGIVAALTIPTVIKNYQLRQTEAKLKKTFAALNSAINMAVKDHGNATGWSAVAQDDDRGSRDWANKYLYPYLKIKKNCGIKRCGTYVQNDCISSRYYSRAILTDGVMICNYGSEVTVDLNGDKAPNKYGYDQFLFPFDKNKNKLYPYPNDSNTHSLISYNQLGCRKDATNGMKFCTRLIALNNWKIPTKEEYIKMGGWASAYPW